MFDVNKVQDGLVGLVGIHQPADPVYAVLDAGNIASSSGLYLDDVSNFKVQFYVDTQDYAEIDNATLNEELRNIQKSAIATVLHRVFGDDSYIDRNFIYTEANNRVGLETTIQNGFVGFKIIPTSTKDIAFKITRIRLEFQGTGDIELVLFNSSLIDPVYTKTISITTASQLEDLDWVINNTNEDYKGEYYLGYEYDGTLVPFKRNYQYSNSRNYISELMITPSTTVGANATTMFNIEDELFMSENTGLNPDITTYEDFTDLILQNKHLFAKAIQLQWAILVMQRYISTTRSNDTERMARETILRTIETIEGSTYKSPIKVTGINTLLGNELATLEHTIKDLKRGYFGDGIQVITAT